MNTRKTIVEIRKTLRKMFWEHWDPIGVNNDPHAVGEYDSYADEVTSFIINSRVVDESKIQKYLRCVMYDHMGLSFSAELENTTEQFEKKLISFWKKIKEQT